ncbi:MAG: hypothetical protein K8S55_12945 [Phycisphaerae bacterium]|nr:hypothetical protein [Phycisphaerae bacterium]
MTDQAKQDEIELIDDLQGRLGPEDARVLRERLAAEPELRRKRDELAKTLDAMDLAPEPVAPDDLVTKTLDRIAAVRRTDALITMQQMETARSFGSTFRMRELAAVAAMLLVLAGLLIPSLHFARQRSRQTLCAAQMGQIGSAMHTYAVNNAGFLPNANGKNLCWLSKPGQPTASNSAGLFKLLRGRHIHSPVAFQCPAVGGNSFTMTPQMTDFPQAQHVHYSYHHSLGSRSLSITHPRWAKVIATMAVLADQTPVFADGQFWPERIADPISDNHGGDGQNVLYMDGHVVWATTATVGVGGDNIYLIQSITQYQGTESPTDPTDTFLLPAWTGR